MVSGVLCGSFQSLLAMGLLQIWVASGVLGARDGRRRRSPTRLQCKEARDYLVISIFSRGFFAFLVGQLSLYPVCSYLYLSELLYVFFVY